MGSVKGAPGDKPPETELSSYVESTSTDMNHASRYALPRLAPIALVLLLLPLLSGSLAAQWSPLAAPPIGATDGSVSFTIGDTAYLAGGIANERILSWHPTTGWRVIATFPDNRPRAWSFALVHDGVAIIGGGDSTGGFTLTDDVFEFNPTTGAVTPKNPMSFGARDGLWSFVIDGKGYLGGGFDGEFVIPDMWEYDFGNDSWRELPQPPMEALIFASTFVVDGKGYVVGGGISFSGSNGLYEFNPETGGWRQRTSFPGHPRQAGIAVAHDGVGYYGIGMDAYDTTFSDIWRYNPVADSWSLFRDDYPDYRSAWSSAFVLGNELIIGTGAGFPSGSLEFTRNFYAISLDGESSVEEEVGRTINLDLE